MISPKSISFLLFLCFSLIGRSQVDTINKIDTNGFKQGYWIIYGAYFPEKNYPFDGKIEEGRYLNGKKVGEWKMYYDDGKTLKLIGTFENGRPGGPYSKYYFSGNLAETGTYKNGKQLGEFKSYYESGCLNTSKFFNEDGREEGTTFIYNDDCDVDVRVQGTVQLETHKENGISMAAETRRVGGTYERITYSNDPCVTIVQANPADSAKVVIGDGGPCVGEIGKTKDGKKFEPDGYNKIYNRQDELWMDGTFKSSRLWQGKLYKYDKDGILLKVEIWKDGKYCCDGQL